MTKLTLKCLILAASLITAFECRAIDLSSGSSEIEAEIEKLTHNKSCKRDSDCSTVGIGWRSCGGPERHLIYSKKKTDAKRLKSLTEKLTQLDRNAKKGMAGICSIEMPPQVACVKGQCTQSSQP